MKSKAFALTAALVAGTMAAPASAFIQAESEIHKYKDIDVFEFVFVDKDIDVDAFVVVNATGVAEASAYLNVLNIANSVNIGVRGPWNTDRDALIQNSINTNIGITGVNQDLGDMNNQANAVAVAYTEITGGAAHSQAGTDQVNHVNRVTPNEVFQPTNPNPLTQLLGSVNFNNGVVGVNQNSGHMNNQTNSAAVAAAEDPIVVLSNADLGQVNAANSLRALGTVKKSEIIGSVSDNIGLVQVNQSGGHMNNQASAISVAAGIGPTSVSGAVGAVTSF
ncbi:MAG: hypothetical protein QNJ30_17015 [Kiloniellales bacterium]|nr:hypothetical protein [Kiloniellales bacterium]